MNNYKLKYSFSIMTVYSVCILLLSFNTLASPKIDHEVKIIEEKVTIGNLVFDVFSAGPVEGELVIFLHGFPESAYEWKYQQQKLANKGYFTVSFNQRGYSPGARPLAIEEYSTSKLAQDVLDIADIYGAETFHLVGHDWGAIVAWTVTAISSERVESLVAISSPHPTAYLTEFGNPNSCQFASASYIFNFLNPGFEYVLLNDDAAMLKMILSELKSNDIENHLKVIGSPEALGAALNWYREAFMPTEPAPLLGSINTPTTLIWGDQDPYICQEAIDATEDFITDDYTLRIIKNSGHWLPELEAKKVSHLIIKQLKKVTKKKKEKINN